MCNNCAYQMCFYFSLRVPIFGCVSCHECVMAFNVILSQQSIINNISQQAVYFLPQLVAAYCYTNTSMRDFTIFFCILGRSQLARQSSLDGTSSGVSGRMAGSGNFGLARPSSSMTNLANISKSSDINLPTRPGSALGLLGSVVTFLGTSIF